MKLTETQSKKLLHERGIWITSACDGCGRLLGAVRWDRRGEPGEWCSAECRDGIKLERPTSASVELAAATSTSRRDASAREGAVDQRGMRRTRKSSVHTEVGSEVV